MEKAADKLHEDIKTLREGQELLDQKEDNFMEDADQFEQEIFLSAKKKLKQRLEDNLRDLNEKRKKCRTFATLETIKLLNDQFKLGVKHI